MDDTNGVPWESMNGHAKPTYDQLRAMEGDIVNGVPPPIHLDAEMQFLSENPDAAMDVAPLICDTVQSNGILSCSLDAPCLNCLARRRYLALKIHRAKYGKPVHPSDAAGFWNKPPAFSGTSDEVASPTNDQGLRNYYTTEIVNGDGKPHPVHVGFSIGMILEALELATQGWPKCSAGRLFVVGTEHKILWIDKPTNLFSWVAGLLKGTDNRLRWKKGDDKVSQEQFFSFCSQKASQYDAVEELPHQPPMPRHFYVHPELKSDGTAIGQLLDKFRPSTDADRDLMLAAILTPFAGIECGRRPAFLIQGEDDDEKWGRGSGKTKFAEMVGKICGGHIDLRANESWDRYITRLLSPAARGKRVAILDNVKTLRFSWADLEAGVTASVISGHEMYAGEGRRPNTLTYFITLNGANMSKDMSQRCVPIKVKRPEYDATWEASVTAIIDRRRWDIIADIVSILKAPAQRLKKFSRWSSWEMAVLARVGDPSECQKTIEERQADVDEDQGDADILRDAIRLDLLRRGHSPTSQKILIPPKVAGQIVNQIENDLHRNYQRAVAHLYTLNVPEIRRQRYNGARWVAWIGSESIGQHFVELIQSL